jgi:hypothetical protein
MVERVDLNAFFAVGVAGNPRAGELTARHPETR